MSLYLYHSLPLPPPPPSTTHHPIRLVGSWSYIVYIFCIHIRAPWQGPSHQCGHIPGNFHVAGVLVLPNGTISRIMPPLSSTVESPEKTIPPDLLRLYHPRGWTVQLKSCTTLSGFVRVNLALILCLSPKKIG